MKCMENKTTEIKSELNWKKRHVVYISSKTFLKFPMRQLHFSSCKISNAFPKTIQRISNIRIFSKPLWSEIFQNLHATSTGVNRAYKLWGLSRRRMLSDWSLRNLKFPVLTFEHHLNIEDFIPKFLQIYFLEKLTPRKTNWNEKPINFLRTAYFNI